MTIKLDQEKTALGIVIGTTGLILTSVVAGIGYAYGNHLVDSGKLKLPGGPHDGKGGCTCLPKKKRGKK